MKKLFSILILFSICLFNVSAQEIEIKELTLNLKQSNAIAPFFHDSVLYYSSNKKSTVVKSVFDQNDEYLYKVYKTRLKPDGSWSSPQLAFENIQSPINNGAIALSENGEELILTQSQTASLKQAQRQKNGDKLGLFFSSKNGDAWTIPQSMSFNSESEFSTGQPAISFDGTKLVFASDMNKGYGKTDLYYCELKNGEWTDPENLGKVINTPERELFPFFHSSGKLFFASDGLGGLGGLDLFYSRELNGQWMEPIALDPPINSEFNDFACWIASSEESGYFTSDRNKSDNIYSFKQLYPSFEYCTPQKIDKYCFTLFENGSYKSDTLPFIYRWTFGDGEFGDGLKVRHCFPGPGSYKIELNVVDTLLNVDLMTVAQHQIELKRTEQVFISCPDTVRLGDVIVLNANESYFKSMEPKEFYWTFNDGKKGKGVTITHIFRKIGTQTVSCGTVAKSDVSIKHCSTKEIVVIE